MSLAVDNDLFSKGEFARRRNVSPGRVSQWISEGKLSGAAIVGEGRNAQIRESVACQQLKVKLEPMQMTGNGLGTKLDAPIGPSIAEVLPFTPPAASPSSPPAADSLEEQIKRQRLEQLERQNREGQREEALKAGQLTDAALAKQMAGRETVRLVTLFEGSLSNFATVIAAEFKLTQRDVLHLLRGEFRKFRSEATSAARAAAEALPATVDMNLAPAQDETESED